MTQREHDDPIDALKAELAAVSPSPEFQARVRQRIAGELDLLRDELAAIAPSPEFAVRVRQGIDAAAETRKASWLSGWRWVVPVGAVAAGVMAVIVLSRSGDAADQITAQAPVQAPTAIETPVAMTNGDRRTTNAGRRVPDSGAQVVPAEPTAADPVLEVITNQPAILRAMYARIAAGATVVETTTMPDTVPEIVVAPIEINPIVVKSLVDPPAVGGAQPIIRRITADTAERSQK
jgi:hypothetical protein